MRSRPLSDRPTRDSHTANQRRLGCDVESEARLGLRPDRAGAARAPPRARARALPPAQVCIDILEAAGVHVDQKQKLNERDLCDIIKDYDGLVVRSGTQVTALTDRNRCPACGSSLSPVGSSRHPRPRPPAPTRPPSGLLDAVASGAMAPP
jgi:hypothetical protein